MSPSEPPTPGSAAHSGGSSLALPPGLELENDPDDNPCFACGPQNPVGIHMRFFDDGEVVRSPLVLDDRYCGWPGSVLEGILYIAMDDIIYWAAWARFGELAIGDGRPEVAYPARVWTNRPFVVEARMGAREGDWTVFESRCVQASKSGEMKVRATMRLRMRKRTDDEVREIAAIPNLPRTIAEEAREMLARREG